MTAALLAPLALLYDMLTRARNCAFDRGYFSIYASPLPTISVGNLSVGGNAKTPLVTWLAAKLQDRGERPVVLSRGYGGSNIGPILVNTSHLASEVGDEPLLMCKEYGLQVVICRSRVEGAKFVEANGLGTVLLLDDGMQHRWLQRDLEIITVDVSTESAIEAFCAGRLVPWGRFRENKRRGLRRVDALVAALRRPSIDEDDATVYRRLGVPSGICQVTSEVVCEKVVHWKSGQLLLPQSVIAWCGIANPQGFIATLQASGFGVVDSLLLQDHKRVDMEALAGLAAKHPGVPLVCTEKDIVKYDSFGKLDCYVCKVGYRVSNEGNLLKQIDHALVHAKNGHRGLPV